MHLNRMDREDHLYKAFQHFDKDNSGYITTEELEQALRDYGMQDGKDLSEIIMEVDNDNVSAHILFLIPTPIYTCSELLETLSRCCTSSINRTEG